MENIFRAALICLMLSTQANAHDHDHASHPNSPKVGMEESSLAYMQGARETSPVRKPFTIQELTGDADMSVQDLLVVSFEDGAKMVTIGRMIEVLNRVEFGLQVQNETLRFCSKSEILRVFIRNIDRKSDAEKPACVRKQT